MSPIPQTASRQAAAPRSIPASPIGNWHPVAVLGEGNWSCVYRARPADRPPESPADYAVKVARQGTPDDPLAVALLRREAVASRSAAHPNLTTVLGGQFREPPCYLVMPLIAGIPLRGLIDRFAPLPVPCALWIARQISQALAAMHEGGWLHGDVKPENILVGDDGHATLIDLGLAEPLVSPQPCSRPVVAVTLLYAAPERFGELPSAAAASDVYSLGVVLFEMLTARQPFAETDVQKLADAHRFQQPPDPRSFSPHLPVRVVRVLRRMLSKEATQRPIGEALVACFADLEIDTFEDRLAA